MEQEETEDESLIHRQGKEPVNSGMSRGCCSWIRAGGLDIVIPLFLLAFASLGVLVYNILRKQIEPCITDRPFAKHFYCYNASAAPGVHMDKRI